MQQPTAQEYLAYRSARINTTKKWLASSGAYLGKPPLGYRRIEEGMRVRIVPEKDEARFVRHAFLMASNPDHPLRQVLRMLQEVGFRTRDGKPLGISSLYKILTNPLYAGAVRFHGELYQGNHEPLVSQELFDRVQRNLAIRRRSGKSSERPLSLP